MPGYFFGAVFECQETTEGNCAQNNVLETRKLFSTSRVFWLGKHGSCSARVCNSWRFGWLSIRAWDGLSKCPRILGRRLVRSWMNSRPPKAGILQSSPFLWRSRKSQGQPPCLLSPQVHVVWLFARLWLQKITARTGCAEAKTQTATIWFGKKRSQYRRKKPPRDGPLRGRGGRIRCCSTGAACVFNSIKCLHRAKGAKTEKRNKTVEKTNPEEASFFEGFWGWKGILVSFQQNNEDSH